MAASRARSILCAGFIVAGAAVTSARAVEVPIKIPGCPERDGSDGESDRDRRIRDEEQTCGGGGAGSDASYAYPGVRLPAIGGAAAGGGGGGTAARTATSQGDAATTGNAAPSGAQTFESTGNVIPSTPTVRPGTAPSAQPAAVTPPAQMFNSTGNVTYPAAAPGGSGGFFIEGPSGSAGHVAPLPDLRGVTAWLVAAMAAAFFWRRRARV